jgi:hypothetical protein
LGKPASFLIDASKAGAGNMEIIVSVGDQNVPNFVQAEGNAKFKVSFTPQVAKNHSISVKFNDESVPGKFFKIFFKIFKIFCKLKKNFKEVQCSVQLKMSQCKSGPRGLASKRRF